VLEKEKLESVYSEKSNEIQNTWKTSKLDIVPGDLLIDKVCEYYGVRFKKEKDTSVLASLMEEDEISLEIKKIIQDIVKTET
jgi:putative ATP-dependent endonuclease of the OLD family